MTIAHIIILLVTGIVAGFGGGLLGLGGAFLFNPILYFVFSSMGIHTDLAVRMAFGTSLLVVLPLAVSGTWHHNKKGTVWWKAAIVMGICTLVTAYGGATLAAYLPGHVLKISFGVIIFSLGVRMLIAKTPQVEPEPRDNPWIWAAWAVPVGVLAGLIGVGGGGMIIPIMVLVFKFNMHTAIATSLAMVAFTSLGGVAGYIVNGIGVPDLPPYSIGYVSLPAWFLLLVGSVTMPQVGVIVAHKLPAKKLKYIFIALQLYLGLRMIGVFDWLGWPI